MTAGADWRPGAPLAMLRRRAEWLATLRGFLDERGIVEVDTPLLARHGVTDPAIESLQATTSGYWLQSSPEYAMKRLIAAGLGDCYQLTRAFRAGEQGRWHNPEFTLLEWYRRGYSADDLMDELWQLTDVLLGPAPMERCTYQAAFAAAGLPDPLSASTGELVTAAQAHPAACPLPRDPDPRELLDWLFSQVVAPQLPGRCLVTHYPADQAVLARLDPRDPRRAERFELFVDGLEMANGFRELTDARALRERFETDQAIRRARGQPVMAIDERLLSALTAGLPDCAGVAVGLDRLFARAVGARSLAEVIAFVWDRA